MYENRDTQAQSSDTEKQGAKQGAAGPQSAAELTSSLVSEQIERLANRISTKAGDLKGSKNIRGGVRMLKAEAPGPAAMAACREGVKEMRGISTGDFFTRANEIWSLCCELNATAKLGRLLEKQGPEKIAELAEKVERDVHSRQISPASLRAVLREVGVRAQKDPGDYAVRFAKTVLNIASALQEHRTSASTPKENPIPEGVGPSAQESPQSEPIPESLFGDLSGPSGYRDPGDQNLERARKAGGGMNSNRWRRSKRS